MCTPEPPPPPKDEYNYTDYLRNKNNEEYKGQWKAPAECPCSGWKSKLGFGGYCKVGLGLGEGEGEGVGPSPSPRPRPSPSPNPNPNPEEFTLQL